MLNIIFDLDGTLIDARQRLYHLFQYLVPSSTLSYEQYWLRKKNQLSHHMILSEEFNYPPEKITAFVTEWMRLIEAPEFLKLDVNFAGMQNFLISLQQKANLYVCTARQHSDRVSEQLEQLKLLSFFNKILVTEQKYAKSMLISDHITQLTVNDWMLGDTGKDIQTGKQLNIKTCGVLSGFMNKETLLAYEPDLILSSAIHFNEKILKSATALQT